MLIYDFQGEQITCSTSGDVCFCEIEFELTCLYESYRFFNDKAQERISDLESYRNHLNSIKRDPKKESFEDFELREDAIGITDHISIDVWKSTSSVSVGFMVVMQIMSLLEFSLKKICDDFSIQPLTKVELKSLSNVEGYIRAIASSRDIDAKLEPYSMKQARSIRNKIAHGDWNEVKTELVHFDVNKAFRDFCSIILWAEGVVSKDQELH